FSSGADRGRKEMERVKKLVEQRREELLKNGLSPDTPIRVGYQRFQIECGVLVGGFRDMESARRELERVRKIRVTPEELARLPIQYEVFVGQRGKGGPNDPVEVSNAKVNPFLKCHVVPNPTVPQSRAAEGEKLNLGQLKRL